MNKNNKKSKKQHNKLIDFVNKYKLYLIIVAFIIIFVAIYVLFGLNKTSYAISNDVDWVSITCPENAAPGIEVECTIKVNVATMKAQAFETHYKLTSGLEYVKYVSNTNCTGNNCWDKSGENSSSSSTAIVYFTGLTPNVEGEQTLGKVTFKIPSTATIGSSYSITLPKSDTIIAGKNSAGNIVSVNPESTTANIKVVKPEEPSSGNIEFTNDFSSNHPKVSIKEGIINRLPVKMTYEQLKAGIKNSNNLNISIKDKNNNDVSNTSSIKTGDKLLVGNNTYIISVLGDVNGDADIDIADVNKLFKYSMGRIQLAKQEFFAGDIVNDDSIEINDVNKLSKYSIGRISDLNS